MAIDPRRLHRLRQVHGGAAWFVRGDEREAGLPDADIIISDRPGTAVAVQAADCVPLLLADPSRPRVVAAAHAGWRGAAARVPGLVVGLLAERFDCDPATLVAAAGPSIGPCCYEVGDDVRGHFSRAGFDPATLARWFLKAATPTAANPSMPRVTPIARDGHWYFDGWRCVADQLVAAGLDPANVHVARLCSASHPALFCSYRRDGTPAGRMAGVIKSM